MKTHLLIDAGGLVQNAIVAADDATSIPLPDGWTSVEPAPGEYYEIGKPRGIARPPKL
jgi:hypothetical protein